MATVSLASWLFAGDPGRGWQRGLSGYTQPPPEPQEARLIIVNDEERPLRPGLTVEALLKELDPRMPMCMVKIDGAYVSRRHWANRELQEGDEVRVVYMIAGG